MLAVAMALASPVAARDSQANLQKQVESTLAQAGPGTRFGLLVMTADGEELVAISPDDRFIPASNTKIFTTAAAFETLAGLSAPDVAGGAGVRLERKGRRVADVVLEGRGDARLSSARDCVVNCLAALADAVAARTRRVRDVVGDDTFFPDERWSSGMSWNNIPTSSGTAISALTLDDNELLLRVTPSAPGEPPSVAFLPYYSVDNEAVTVASGDTDLAFERLPGSKAGRLTGTIAAGAEPELLRLGIDDPANYAAWRLKSLLEERGVRVSGQVTVVHRPLLPTDGSDILPAAPQLRPRATNDVARLLPPPLLEDIRRINKASQNVHAELLLRRVGGRRGSGSSAHGLAEVRAMLERASVPRWAYDLSDGSGMSTYNRVAPRGMVALLRWIAGRPWGAGWRATLPVAGIDGTLRKRFRGTSLEGRLFAKTGSLNATTALAGYFIARSGRMLTFAAYANDVPEDVEAARAIDSALALIAQQN
jgi:D-alanyl-D-alanine carboxypeptidase/D-alanyl-D-alanine-endopeptidase (penicillin-binding protein 4)